MKRVLVFGVFDGLHEGHRAFLTQAKALGTSLTVCLAQDSVVQELKGQPPAQSFSERQLALESSGLVDHVLPGDQTLGTYTCMKESRPNIIAFGYDQQTLRNDLEAWLIKTGSDIEQDVLSPYKPDIYKSSKLRRTT